ncbi:Homoserine O-acetyltransferase (HAT) (Homoserine transacetylase) (HTA) [Durusdinium trenchii]|uniref:Homoserine O-acetyltransferase (HAT) (Homoserine transacetylase) (HTA) n=1 Tax=Durusdinium trenchii TaxID=1381693 RepID=A0ABP0KK32_9DINO
MRELCSARGSKSAGARERRGGHGKPLRRKVRALEHLRAVGTSAAGDAVELSGGCEDDGEEDDDEDEYKNIDWSGETFVAGDMELENGRVLKRPQVRYRTFGTLNKTSKNGSVVCHALTGNASLDDWWGGMLGEGKLFDSSKMFIVCANILGSCYGTCGPTSVNPDTGKVYGSTFPDVTIRDSVRLHMQLVREHLGVRRVACVIGGSLGGMQTLEWAYLGGADGFVGAIIPMCCGGYHHPWQIGISESQRLAIYADPNWQDGKYLDLGRQGPTSGLSVARSIAMITYRSHPGYVRKFGRHEVAGKEAGHGQERFFEVEGYLRHQGNKFCGRFDALSYVKVTRMMDTHDMGRCRDGGVEASLRSIKQPTLIISVKSDILYPPSEQQFLHEHIPNSRLFEIDSDHGHDGFLLDQDHIMPEALKFLQEHVYGPLEHADAAAKAASAQLRGAQGLRSASTHNKSKL